MSARKGWQRELDKLFHDRVFQLRKAMGFVKRGNAPIFDKHRLERGIKRLDKLASAILDARIARQEFRTAIEGRKRWHPKKGKGWGITAKRKKFKIWFDNQVGFDNYIYIFWSGRSPNIRCEYVGQSTRGKTRPQSHFEKFWFQRVTRIDLWSIRNRSEVTKLECLAIHYFDPRMNKVRAANKRWTKKCPICEKHRKLQSELKNIFALKHKRAKRRKR
jgi:hypothetical protein